MGISGISGSSPIPYGPNSQGQFNQLIALINQFDQQIHETPLTQNAVENLISLMNRIKSQISNLQEIMPPLPPNQMNVLNELQSDFFGGMGEGHGMAYYLSMLAEDPNSSEYLGTAQSLAGTIADTAAKLPLNV